MPNKVWLLCIYRKNMKPLLEGSVSSMQKDIAFENECNIKKKNQKHCNDYLLTLGVLLYVFNYSGKCTDIT